MLTELLKKYLVEDDKVNQFLEEMKSSKIYTTKEENIDTRYSKLNDNFNAKNQELVEAQNLIKQLQESNKGNEALQGKITEYESTIAKLQAENKELEMKSALKDVLNENHALDTDYLMYQIEKGGYELKQDDKGKFINIDDVMNGLKENFPNQFEKSAKKVVDVKELPDEYKQPATITKEQFDKMGYKARVELFENNKELYDKLTGKGE